jgi:hypothetical protein
MKGIKFNESWVNNFIICEQLCPRRRSIGMHRETMQSSEVIAQANTYFHYFVPKSVEKR